jgi:hypothetical protein
MPSGLAIERSTNDDKLDVFGFTPSDMFPGTDYRKGLPYFAKLFDLKTRTNNPKY